MCSGGKVSYIKKKLSDHVVIAAVPEKQTGCGTLLSCGREIPVLIRRHFLFLGAIFRGEERQSVVTKHTVAGQDGKAAMVQIHKGAPQWATDVLFLPGKRFET